MSKTKVCNTCNKRKEVTVNFYKSNINAEGEQTYRGKCKECTNAARRKTDVEETKTTKKAKPKTKTTKKAVVKESKQVSKKDTKPTKAKSVRVEKTTEVNEDLILPGFKKPAQSIFDGNSLMHSIQKKNEEPKPSKVVKKEKQVDIGSNANATVSIVGGKLTIEVDETVLSQLVKELKK